MPSKFLKRLAYAAASSTSSSLSSGQSYVSNFCHGVSGLIRPISRNGPFLSQPTNARSMHRITYVFSNTPLKRATADHGYLQSNWRSPAFARVSAQSLDKPRKGPGQTRNFTTSTSAGVYVIHRKRPDDCPELKNPVIVDEQMGVAMITLNRPDQLNALNLELMSSLMAHLKRLDADPAIKVMVIKGNGRAFAAGADIKELSQIQSYSQAREVRLLDNWDDMLAVRKPIIAAVHGACLGGGCELAMACDIIFAAESARFGLPEVTLGLIPGGGGTQRVARRVGKSRAMEMILTGQTLTAYEADRYGLVSTIVPDEQLVDRAYDKAQAMVVMSSPVLQKAKECVNAAFEMPLEEGLLFEKREFWSCFALDDAQEGMAAFMEKRRPHFKHK